MRDFEVAGMQLNGASNVHVSNVKVGPSLGAPASSGLIAASATFSIAQFMLNTITNTGIEQTSEFGELKSLVDNYVASNVQGKSIGKQTTLFDDPSEGFMGLPGGSAIYGIHFHTSGPATHEFTACASAQQNTYSRGSSQFHLSHVFIEDLYSKTDEVVR